MVDRHLDEQELLPFHLRCPDPRRAVIDPSLLGSNISTSDHDVTILQARRSDSANITFLHSSDPEYREWDERRLEMSDQGYEDKELNFEPGELNVSHQNRMLRRNQPLMDRAEEEPFAPLLRSYKLSTVISILTRCVSFFRMIRDRKSLEEVSRESNEIRSQVLLRLQQFSANATGRYLRKKKYRHQEMVRYDDRDNLYYLLSRYIQRGNRTPLQQKWQVLTVLDSPFTQSAMWETHTKHHMMSLDETWRIWCKDYATPHGRKAFTRLAHWCNLCKRIRREVQIVPMGGLPVERLQNSPLFSHVMMDFTGVLLRQLPKDKDAEPFDHTKKKQPQPPTFVKRYAMVLVCFSTQTVSLQAVDSLDTSAVILGLSSFFSQRGRCLSLSSDLQKSFVSAYKLLAASHGEQVLDQDEADQLHLTQQARRVQVDLNNFLGVNNISTRTPAAHSPNLQALAERKMSPVKKIVSAKYYSHCETDNSFAHHLHLTSEYINSIPYYIDKNSNTFFTRQHLLIDLAHRPGSLD